MCTKHGTVPKNFKIIFFGNFESNHAVKTSNTGNYYNIFLRFYIVVLAFLGVTEPSYVKVAPFMTLHHIHSARISTVLRRPLLIRTNKNQLLCNK